MVRIRSWTIPMCAAFVLVLLVWGSAAHGADRVIAATGKTAACRARTGLVRPINPTVRDWVLQELADGRSALLTNSYLFQVMKGISQENQRMAEELILCPLLKQTLTGLVSAASDEQVKRLFGVPLALLGLTDAVDLPEEVKQQAEAVKQNPLFTPRGHYADSEILQAYFRAMQYLAKASIDVSINRDRFPLPAYMLYPFDTAVSAVSLFQDPKNKRLLEHWTIIHQFYTGLNGKADLPTLADLADIAAGKPPTKDAIRDWAKAHNLPRINREIGLAVQPLGERFSMHEQVIDDAKRLFARDDTPREEIARILHFPKLFHGMDTAGKQFVGLGSRMESAEGGSYYDRVMRAIGVAASRNKNGQGVLNFRAACLTALAEQTALMAKASVMVQKSIEERQDVRKGLKLFFEPGSKKYLLSLADAAAAITGLCSELKRQAPQDLATSFVPVDVAPALKTFSVMAGRSRPLITGGRSWKRYGAFVTCLARHPAVAVDVFHLKDRSGAMSYYQWGIAPFICTGAHRTKGMEMVFFEGWSDEIIPQHEGPLTNQQWQDRINQGNLHLLNSLMTIPRLREVR